MGKNVLLFCVLLFIMTSCGISFTPVNHEEIRSSGSWSIEKGDIYYTNVYEDVLVKNFPRDTARLIETLTEYWKLHGRSLESLDSIDDFGYYSMDFYINNYRTRMLGIDIANDKTKENDLIASIMCLQRDPEGEEHLGNPSWEISIRINLNNSESFEYLGRNYKTFIIRNDCEYETY